MDSQELRNLQEAYLDVYTEERAPGVKPYQPNRLNPLPSAKPLSGKRGDGSGYGKDEKFNKPDDKIKPGTEVPAPKKGGYGRISRSTPYGIGANANRTSSNVNRIVGGDEGAPRAVKMPTTSTSRGGKKPLSKEIVRRSKKEESFDLYDLILSHLLDEGYAETQEAAEAIMVNMSEEWIGSIIG